MSLSNYICTTCGVQYEASELPPLLCPICSNDRQYIGLSGQTWTTLSELNRKHKNIVEKIQDDVYAIYTAPVFGINQRAHLIKTPGVIFYGIALVILIQQLLRYFKTLEE